MFKRMIQIEERLTNRSVFLFGPRQTGKSTLLKMRFPSAMYIDLLNSKEYLQYTSSPSLLEERVNVLLKSPGELLKVVIIDEIRREPELLNDVHRLIEMHKNLRFILTGSSPNKLRRKGTNLLGGRAHRINLHPISWLEMQSWPGSNIDFNTRLLRGGLPSILLSNNFRDDLLSYVGLYLQEEIQAEGLARSVGNFSRFLHVAAVCNGQQINYASVASDTMIPARTVKDYFQILQDTMMGYMLSPIDISEKRKTVSNPKFYFFDTGVSNALQARWNLLAGTPEYGEAFEAFIHNELQAANQFFTTDFPLTYWRTKTQLEVDFVLRPKPGVIIGIETKGTGKVQSRDTRGLRAFADEFLGARKILICTEENERLTTEGIEILPVEIFLSRLWKGEYHK